MRLDIYFATKSLTITDQYISGYEIIPEGDHIISRQRLLEILEREHRAIIRCGDAAECEATLTAFSSQFIAVTAAGGVVERDDKSILMIYRNRRWDLPKGHWEEGETIEECAVREVEEECGVRDIVLGEPLCETLHAYYLRNNWEIKRTHWYSMSSNDTAPLTPQREEGIERAEWLTPEEVEAKTRGSFPTIKEVIRAFRNR